jgi:hypothetical protein
VTSGVHLLSGGDTFSSRSPVRWHGPRDDNTTLVLPMVGSVRLDRPNGRETQQCALIDVGTAGPNVYCRSGWRGDETVSGCHASRSARPPPSLELARKLANQLPTAGGGSLGKGTGECGFDGVRKGRGSTLRFRSGIDPLTWSRVVVAGLRGVSFRLTLAIPRKSRRFPLPGRVRIPPSPLIRSADLFPEVECLEDRLPD